MKKMALVNKNNIVVNIAIFDDDFNQDGWDDWIEYTEDNPAYIDGDYLDGFFYAPQPFPSWIRNEGQWLPPVPMPDTEGFWQWNEELQKWEQRNPI